MDLVKVRPGILKPSRIPSCSSVSVSPLLSSDSSSCPGDCPGVEPADPEDQRRSAQPGGERGDGADQQTLPQHAGAPPPAEGVPGGGGPRLRGPGPVKRWSEPISGTGSRTGTHQKEEPDQLTPLSPHSCLSAPVLSQQKAELHSRMLQHSAVPAGGSRAAPLVSLSQGPAEQLQLEPSGRTSCR